MVTACVVWDLCTYREGVAGRGIAFSPSTHVMLSRVGMFSSQARTVVVHMRQGWCERQGFLEAASGLMLVNEEQCREGEDRALGFSERASY